ncbi:MAG TPA: hypothetical protein VFA71_05325, partial [Terriglobales bacterium]|nr:hypothetical protein [Terriglobales bacterium]
TGGFIPFTADSPQVYFSPDNRLVYAVPDKDAQVHVYGFDPATGALKAMGAPAPFTVPYGLFPARRN